MGWITIDIRCADCDLVTDIMIDRDERSSTWGCPECGGPMSKTISAPNFTRKSYVDGTRRKGFAEMKEAVKLEREMMDLPPEQRKGHQRAIKELKKIK